VTSGPLSAFAPRAAVSLALSLFDMDFPGTVETLRSICEQFPPYHTAACRGRVSRSG